MYVHERHKQLVNHINKVKKDSVKNLSALFSVSQVTIRRDLEELSNRGLIIKTHGGALSISNSLSTEIPYLKKFSLNTDAKKKIGKAAAEIIKDNDVVILDAGSTTLEIARHLNNVNNVTVITNDLKISMILSNKPNISLVVTGGSLQKSVYTLAGHIALDFLSKVYVDKAFIGVDAFSLECGITNRTISEIPIKRAMMKSAAETIAVFDSSKLNTRVFAHLCDLKDIQKIIIDTIDIETEKFLSELDIEIIVPNGYSSLFESS